MPNRRADRRGHRATGAASIKDMGKVMGIIKARPRARRHGRVGREDQSQARRLIARGPWPAAFHNRFIDEIVARSDIVEVIGARVPLKKGARIQGLLPVPQREIALFLGEPDKQFYHCFGCGAHGTVVGFLMQYEKLEFVDAWRISRSARGSSCRAKPRPPRSRHRSRSA
jgi:hypothetical protein